jgi:hypothetical protein
VPATTLETVAVETLARAATSLIVAERDPDRGAERRRSRPLVGARMADGP